MFFRRKNNNQEPNSSVQWVNIIVIAMVLIAIVNNVGKHLLGEPTPAIDSLQTAAAELTPDTTELKTKIFPGQTDKVKLKDITSGFARSETCGYTFPSPGISAYRIIDAKRGSGTPITCQRSVQIHVAIWSVDGKKLHDSSLAITPGKSEMMMGLEQGVIGLQPGGTRTLIIPPAFQKTLNGNPPTITFPLPSNQTVLVDVEMP